MPAFLLTLISARATGPLRAVEPPQPLLRFGGEDAPLDSLRAVAGSPDGRVVALAGEPASPGAAIHVQLRDAATGALLRRLSGHEAPVRALSFSRRGDRVVTVTSDADGTGLLRLFDTGSGELLRSGDAGGRVVRHLSDGRILVAGAGRVLLFEPDAIREVARFPAMPVIRDVSGDGQRVIGLSHHGQSELEVRELSGGRTLARLMGASGEPLTTGLSFDGRTAAASDAKTKSVLVWETLTGGIVHRIPVNAVVVSLAFTADDRHMITGGLDRTVGVWEVSTGIQTARFTAHEGPVLTLATVAGDRLLTGSSDRTAALWTLAPLCGTHLPPEPSSPESRDAVWEALAAQEPAPAYVALGRIGARPQELLPDLVARVERQLVPVPDADLARLLGDLDHSDYLTRERAHAELQQAGERMRPHLERALADTRSPEVRSRLRLLLRRAGAAPRFSPKDLLRLRRLIGEAAALEGENSVRLLTLISEKFPDAAVAAEAKDALQRLSARPPH